jgi:outer membrane protein OmpA-like peptidoglycan-associated protein
MKNRYKYILSALCAVVSLGVSAQQLSEGIEVTNLRLTNTGSEFSLEISLQIAGDAVGKCESVAVVPSLTGNSHTLDFPYILINGHKAKNIYNRRNKFGYTELRENPPHQVVNLSRKPTDGTTVSYSATISAETSNEGASLKLGIVVISCGSERRQYSVATTAAVLASQPTIEQPNSEPVEDILIRVGGSTIEGSAYLDFKTDNYQIHPEYMRNAAELAVIHNIMGQIKANPTARITALSIVGYASPEERLANNERLAYERAISLAKYLQPLYGISVRDSKVSGVAEDWVKLRELVVASGIAHKSEILQIIDSSDHPDVKESKLRRLAGGRPWKVMIDTMFPKLRRVEYKVEYTKAE